MNITTNLLDIWFTVLRIGKKRIVVQKGCVFNYNGKCTELSTGNYGGQLMPQLLTLESHPSDDIGSHNYIEAEEFDVQNGDKVWLQYELSTEDTFWKCSIVGDNGESLILEYDTSGYAVIKIRDHFLNKKTLKYSVTNSDFDVPADSSIKYVLIAEIVIDPDTKILEINQIHEGVFVTNRFQEIIGIDA